MQKDIWSIVHRACNYILPESENKIIVPNFIKTFKLWGYSQTELTRKNISL